MATQKQFIIKADDYGRGGANLDPWRRFIDCALDEYLTISIGVVASEFTQNKAIPLYLRSIVEEYGIEVWNHSNTHPNFTQLNKDQIEKEIFESQKIIENELGVRPKIFGPPFNKIDQASAQHVIDTNEFSGYYALDGLVDRGKNIELKYFSGVEIGTDAFRPMRQDVFETEMQRREWPDFIVLQLHPYYWSSNCLITFKKILKILGEQGYICVSAEDRNEYFSKKVKKDTTYRAGQSLADNLMHEEQSQDILAADVESKDSNFRSDSPYYFRVLKDGTAKIANYLRSLGFNNMPRVNGKMEIIDVGSGIGNWSAAAALLPNSHVLSLDREGLHLGFLQDKSDNSKITVQISSLENCNFQAESFSGVICNNAINYMDIKKTFENFSNVLVYGGGLFLGLQNRLYPLRDALDCVKNGDLSKAKLFLDRLIDNEGFSLGMIDSPFIRYWNARELQEIGLYSGLKLQRRSLGLPGQYGSLFGQQIFSGFFFTKTKAALKLKNELISKGIPSRVFRQFNNISRPNIHELINAIAGAINTLDGNDIEKTKEGFIKILNSKGLAISNLDNSISRLFFYLKCRSIELEPAPLDGLPLDGLFGHVFMLYRGINLNKPNEINAIVALIEESILKMPYKDLEYWC